MQLLVLLSITADNHQSGQMQLLASRPSYWLHNNLLSTVNIKIHTTLGLGSSMLLLVPAMVRGSLK